MSCERPRRGKFTVLFLIVALHAEPGALIIDRMHRLPTERFIIIVACIYEFGERGCRKQKSLLPKLRIMLLVCGKPAFADVFAIS